MKDRLTIALLITAVFLGIALMGAALGALQGGLINWTMCGHPLRTCEQGKAVGSSVW